MQMSRCERFVCHENMLEELAIVPSDWRCADEKIQQGTTRARIHRSKNCNERHARRRKWAQFNFKKVSIRYLLPAIACFSHTGSATPSSVQQVQHTFYTFSIYLFNRRSRTAIVNARKIQRPKRLEMVYLDASPNYCDRDLSAGSLGTIGRPCNRTARGLEGCDLLCCGRGYNTHQINRQWQCRCKFQWCCRVHCDICEERLEQYTCK